MVHYIGQLRNRKTSFFIESVEDRDINLVQNKVSVISDDFMQSPGLVETLRSLGHRIYFIKDSYDSYRFLEIFPGICDVPGNRTIEQIVSHTSGGKVAFNVVETRPVECADYFFHLGELSSKSDKAPFHTKFDILLPHSGDTDFSFEDEIIILYQIPGTIWFDDPDTIGELISLEKSTSPPTTPILYLIVGPSGAGKTTLVEHISGYVRDLHVLKKHTDRPKRPEEINKIMSSDYKPANSFGFHNYMEFLYWYQTEDIKQSLDYKFDLISDVVDIQTAMNVKNLLGDYCRLIGFSLDYNQVARQLYKRIIPVSNTGKFNNPKEIVTILGENNSKRIDSLLTYCKEYQIFLSSCDYVIHNRLFGFRQRELRNYILKCRRGEA